MATYTIQAPDGNSYSVQGPDNAPQSDVQAEVLRQHPEAGTPPVQAQQPPTQPQGSGQGGPIQASPTDGMSTADLAVAGMGKAFHEMGQGITQMVGSPAAKAQTAADIVEDRKYDKQLEATNAGKAGEMLGHMAVLAAAPEGLIGGMAAGAAAGAMTPTAQGESRAANIALNTAFAGGGHAAGALLGKVVGGVIQPFRNTLSETAQAGADTLTAAGVPLSAAQQGGGKIAQTLSNVVQDNPLIGSNLSTQQKAAFTAAVLKNVGVDSPTADAATMYKVKAALGAKFDAMAAKYPIPVDQQMLTKLATVETAANSELDATQLSVIKAQLNNIIDKGAANGGSIPGQAFQNIRSSLSRIQSQPQSGVVGHWAGEIHDALMNALGRNASQADQKAITSMRTQYRALKQIEPAIQSDDNVSPSLLYNSLDRQKNINQMVYGQGDQSLVQLATAGKNVLGTMNTPNSGTAQRVAGMLMMGSSMAAVDKLAGGDTKDALKIGLLGVAGPQLARIVSENPASARLIAQWARSKVLSNFRGVVNAQGAKMASLAGSSALPSTGGPQSDFMQSNDDNQNLGETEQ